MKRKVFIRISNKTNIMDISLKRKFSALNGGSGYNKKYFPTITLELNLDIPDGFFTEAQKKLDIKITQLNINDDIKVEEIKGDEQ